MNPQELARWMQAHAAQLVLYARQICRSPEDVVQEAFVESLKLTKLPDNPRAWLFEVVRNKALNHTRAEKRRARRERLASTRTENWFDASTETQLDGRQVAADLETLDSDLRETVVARIWGQLSFEEIGKLMDVSTSTVHRRFERALMQLKNKSEASRDVSGEIESANLNSNRASL